LKTNNYILTIAGLDPSSGAGITSDIKTFEAHQLYGLSVCTAVTVQNDTHFESCKWIDVSFILSQIEILFKRFEISVVKIGIIESWSVLLKVMETLKELNPEIIIVLDPILKASAGFTFHDAQELTIFEKVLEKCDFITPNYDEIQALFPDKTIAQTIRYMMEKTNIYLKGGHSIDNKGWDNVYYNNTVTLSIPPRTKHVIYEKHGSGCVLSSALASNLLWTTDIKVACENAKYYTEAFLNSTTSLLGQHSYPLQKS